MDARHSIKVCEEKLHKICDSLGCWEAEIGYDPEFDRLYLKLND